MKRIIFTLVFAIAVNAILAQTYNMKIKQGTVTVYSQTSTVDEITFDNTTNFTCGNPILYGGDLYPTVLIGSQCWFQKNLNICTRIACSSDQTDNSIIEKYCYNDLDASCTTYGGYYQWDEAMQYVTTEEAQGICPPGWHIPTLDDFTTLKASVVNFGNDLKAIGQGTGSGVGTNTSGFSALLAGYRGTSGNFTSLGIGTSFCSSTEYTEYSATMAYYLSLYDDFSGINLGENFKGRGFSVRCLKD